MTHRLLPIALLAVATALASCTTTADVGQGSSFAEALELYRLGKSEKAMAVAVDASGRRAWGFLDGSLTKDHAKEKAVESCRRSAERAGVAAPCRLFAVGDAPAPETAQACREGRLPERFCMLQGRLGS